MLEHLTCLEAQQAASAAAAACLANLSNLRQLVYAQDRFNRTAKWKKHDFSPLMQLQHFTDLRIVFTCKPNALSKSATEVLAQLTRLCRLDMPSISLEEQLLEKLTSLSRLTYLSFNGDQLGILLPERLRMVTLPNDLVGFKTFTIQNTVSRIFSWLTVVARWCMVCAGGVQWQ